MAACKAALDAAHGVNGSTVVTAMARNGVEFGIRVSGTGARWFTDPAPVIDGLYFPGYGPADANPDLGDSAITETAGIGGFAMGGAPAIVRFVGGTPADAVGYTRAMYGITLTRNPEYTLPALGFAGTPTGIDLRRVVESGVAPGDQHRHRAPRAGDRPDRRRHRARPARLLRRRAPGPGRRARRHRLARMTTAKTRH